MNILKTDYLITWSWATDTEVSHKISGHLFEAIDKWLDFKCSGIDYNLLIPDTGDYYLRALAVIEDRYKPKYFKLIKEAIETGQKTGKGIIYGRPKFIKAIKVIICDGVPPDCIIDAKVDLWLCSNDLWWLYKNSTRGPKSKKERIRLLMGAGAGAGAEADITLKYTKEIHQPTIDTNIDKIKEFGLKLGDHQKMVTAKYLKEPTQIKNGIFIYITQNCRSIETIPGAVQDIVTTVLGILMREDDTCTNDPCTNDTCTSGYLLIAGSTNTPLIRELTSKIPIPVTVVPENELPIKDIHEKFRWYVYTPTSKNWDCSPRFIKECAIYQKEVVLTPLALKDLDENLGLKYALAWKPTVATPTVETPTVAKPTVATPTVATPTVATPTVATKENNETKF